MKGPRNPFEVMAEEAGHIQVLMERLHPLSFTTVYQYVKGRVTGISNVMRQALRAHFTDDEIDQMDKDYREWRKRRSERF